MLIIARTTGVQTVVMNGNSVNMSDMIVSCYEPKNRKVLSRCLKTASDGADAT